MILIIVALAAGFGYYYYESSGTINGLNQTVSSQQSQLSEEMTQLAVAQEKVSNLTKTVSTLNSEVVSLQSMVNADEAQIATLTLHGTQANTTIGSLTAQISTLDSNITSLNAQIAGLNNQIAGLNSQIASEEGVVSQLQSTIRVVNSALGSSTAQLVYSNDSFSVGAGGMKSLTFSSTSAGGFVVVGVISSTSGNTTITIKSVDGGSLSPVNVGRTGVTGFALAASTSYTVNFYDLNNGAFSANVNVWYFHS